MSANSSSRGKRSAVVMVTSPSPVREPGTSLPRSGVASSLTPRISGHLMAAAVTSSASEGSITCSPSSKTQAAEAIQRVETWAQAEILSDDEAWDFRTQDTLDTQGRKSMLPGDGRARWNHSQDLPTKALTEAELQPLKDQQTRLLQTVNTLSQQLDELRRGQDRALESTTTLQTMSEEIQVWLSSREQSASKENTTQSQQRIEEDLVGVKKTLELLADHIKDPPPQPHLPQLKKDLQPITERLDAVSSELRTMRQLKERTPPPPAPSVCTEMALADIVKQIRKPTYAQVASKPSVPRPNHTLIISSTDPKNTGDNVIEKIRVALDCKKTGAKVEKVRKAKNQKVILSCGTKEDMKAAERNSTLKNRNPTVTNLDSQTSSTTAVSGIPRTTITDLPTIGERQILLHGEHGAKGMRIRGVALFMSTGSERLGIAFCNTTHQKWLTISPGLASLLNGSTSKTSMRRRVFEALPEIKLVGQSCRLLRMRNKTIAMFSGVDAVTCFEQACKVLSGISKWGQVEGVQSRVISVDAAVVASEKGKIADLMGCVQASEYHEVIVYEDRGEDLSFLRKPVQDPPSVGSLSDSERLQQRHLEQSALQQQQRNAERQHKERTSRSNLCNLTYKTDKLHWHCWNRLTAACAETSCIPKCSTVGGAVGWVAPFPT
ncbi:hypothetical protein SFRURICE_019464 [Spodoptera frugiperda]|nr:hypothetical protein SFRURICE_019464 [Spodoptera frugiperda]